MGQGSDTAMAQIAADVLDVDAEDVRIVHPDTDMTPYDMGTLGSRSTFHMGTRGAARRRGCPRQAAGARRGGRAAGGHQLSAAEIFRKRYGMQAGNVIGSGDLHSDLPASRQGHRPVGQRHAVLDDRRCRRRGRGRYRNRPGAGDAARQCRRLRHADQSRHRDDATIGRRHHGARLRRCSRAWSSTAARSPTRRSPTTRSPASTTFRPCTTRRFAPCSATARSAPRGWASRGRFGVSPAIANAIDDAVGVRLTDLPLTPEAILRALRAKQGRPIEDDE